MSETQKWRSSRKFSLESFFCLKFLRLQQAKKTRAFIINLRHETGLCTFFIVKLSNFFLFASALKRYLYSCGFRYSLMVRSFPSALKAVRQRSSIIRSYISTITNVKMTLYSGIKCRRSIFSTKWSLNTVHFCSIPPSTYRYSAHCTRLMAWKSR